MTENFDPIEWLTTKEAEELTGYDAKYLRRLVSQGKIKGIKRARSIFIDKDSALAYVEKMKELGTAKHDPWRTGARKRSKDKKPAEEKAG
jgi:hypothetical protein